MSIKRFAALLLCSALALCLLAGCGGSGSGADSSASSEASPSSTAEASASGILPEEDDNSLVITDPASAFEGALGWGQGTAGTSLKSIAAAADMLKWAEDNNLSHQSASSAKTTVKKWYDSLTDAQQEGLAEAWPLIKEDANTLLTDKSSISGAIEDAGLDIKKLPGCSKANWDALQDILDGIIPAAAQ